MERSDLLDILWASVSEKLFITREQFVAALEGYSIEPFQVDGELALIFVAKGPEFHFHAMPGRRVPTIALNERVKQLIAEHGHATTRTPKEDTLQHKINERFGFVRTGEDEYDVLYRVDKLKERRASCP